MNGFADAGYFAVGLIAGALHVALLRRNAELYVRPHGLGSAIGLQLLRLVVLGAVLVALALQGAVPLLLGALGVVVSRRIVLCLYRSDRADVAP